MVGKKVRVGCEKAQARYACYAEEDAREAAEASESETP